MLIPDGAFRKSTFSKPGVHYCVEVSFDGESVAVRDSKNPHVEPQHFTKGEWNAFIQGVKDGEFDLQK